MPIYRCARSGFSQSEYERFSGCFYAMPAAWGEGTERPALAALWEGRNVGAIGILPILGMYAHASFADRLHLSKERLARLAGVDPASVARGAERLRQLGLATPIVKRRAGMVVTQWCLSPTLTMPRAADGRFGPDYFHFSGRLLGGANWARMSGAQRAVFLALATRARCFSEAPADLGALRYRLPPATPLDDLTRCHRECNRLRLVLDVSFSMLAELTGMDRGVVADAIRTAKHPRVWPGVANDTVALRHLPIGVYPGDGGTLVYHIRDHAPHWPWEIAATWRPRRPARHSPVFETYEE